ncbi:NYN domain-containing protein [Pedomonas sp. V897]|uniref:NYN domain-containing protein n=1 Tax=Pedomonas sp. V897 TaxID=3446482 RepID=UPI003EDF7F29
MKTIIYVDGFNLYHRALKKTKHKWLDIRALCQAALPRNQDILQINYYTARVSGKIDPEAAKDQNSYLKALSTTPTLKIHYGSFQVTEKYMYLCQPIDFQPSCLTEPDPMPRFARVVKIEEKGSDVNLGAHLVRDAFAGAFQHAAVITNDTDLREPIRIVAQEAKLPITLLSPVSKPAESLRNVATYVRHIDRYLAKAQFPNPLVGPDGQPINKPQDW